MSPRDPKRLRLVAGSALQRRVLAATAEEEPSPELRDRMAGALGVSAAAIGAASGAAVAKATVSATKAAAGISTTSAHPWITVGVLGLAVAGAIFSAREWKASVRPSPAPAPRMIASAPDFPRRGDRTGTSRPGPAAGSARRAVRGARTDGRRSCRSTRTNFASRCRSRRRIVGCRRPGAGYSAPVPG